MRIVTFNVNGIRSAINKGFIEWIKKESYDIICLQEVKANKDDIDISVFEEIGYHVYWYAAQKKGYSGVAIFSKYPAIEVKYGQGMEQSDFEGRVIQVELENCIILSTYFPSGTSGEERQAYKYIWLDDFYEYIDQLESKVEKPVIICGDYNIAHQEIDIHNPKSNAKSSGFLPEERNWMTKFFEKKWVDCYRQLKPEEQKYTWWSFRANARGNNKGWRIDYISINNRFKNILQDSELRNDIVMSDHCPVELTLNL